jgi:hypothetical protein
MTGSSSNSPRSARISRTGPRARMTDVRVTPSKVRFAMSVSTAFMFTTQRTPSSTSTKSQRTKASTSSSQVLFSDLMVSTNAWDPAVLQRPRRPAGRVLHRADRRQGNRRSDRAARAADPRGMARALGDRLPPSSASPGSAASSSSTPTALSCTARPLTSSPQSSTRIEPATARGTPAPPADHSRHRTPTATSRERRAFIEITPQLPMYPRVSNGAVW